PTPSTSQEPTPSTSQEPTSPPTSVPSWPEYAYPPGDVLESPEFELLGPTLEGDGYSFSSPRLVDLNGDGVLDIVLGLAVRESDGAITGGVLAQDGRTGEELWRVSTKDDMFGSAVLMDVGGHVPDILIAGRSASLLRIDGASGEVVWSFLPDSDGRDEGWYHFFGPVVVDDVDGDGVPDIIVPNGGDGEAPPFSPRPAGHIVLLSGASGDVIHRIEVPDGAETYMSLVRYQRAGTDWLLFGTGGETHAGSLWRVPLASVLAGTLDDAVELVAPTMHKGIIAPPAVGDLTGDGEPDVVVATFDGRIVAVDGETLEELWTVWVSDPEATPAIDAETMSTPAIGRFGENGELGVAASFSIGVYPYYTRSEHLLVLGTGEVIWRQQSLRAWTSGPWAIDLHDTGRDLAVFASTNFGSPFPGTRVAFVDPGSQTERHSRRLDDTMVGTGWIGDVNGDGHMEFISARFRGFAMLEVPGEIDVDPEWVLDRRDLNALVPPVLSWPEYMGPGGMGNVGR
ncbi:MAG: hypothetical protein EA398_12820, partial [Deltaproteobacteria bacterium]